MTETSAEPVLAQAIPTHRAPLAAADHVQVLYRTGRSAVAASLTAAVLMTCFASLDGVNLAAIGWLLTVATISAYRLVLFARFHRIHRTASIEYPEFWLRVVERDEQIAILRRLGIDMLQGYAVGRETALAEVLSLSPASVARE